MSNKESQQVQVNRCSSIWASSELSRFSNHVQKLSSSGSFCSIKQKKKKIFEEGPLRSLHFVQRSTKRLALRNPDPIAYQKVIRQPAKRYRLDFAGGTIQSVGNENDPFGSLSLGENCGTNRNTAVNLGIKVQWDRAETMRACALKFRQLKDGGQQLTLSKV